MCDISRDEDEVERTLPRDLVRNMDVSTLRVAGLDVHAIILADRRSLDAIRRSRTRAPREILNQAMSQEHVDWVQRALDHFGRTGEPYLEGIDPAIEVYDHDIPDASNPYRGSDGIGRWLADFGESWERYGLRVEQILDGGDKVVALVRISAVGAGSGVAVERGDGIVCTFRNGLVVRIDWFNDQQLALDAGGLRD